MGRIERTRRRGRRARYARSHAVASHNPSLRQGPKVSLRSAPGGPATYQTASNGSLSSQAHYEKLRSFQLRARLRDAAEGPRSTMAAPRGYWLTAKGHCTSRQLVATRKGPAPMGILRTHNKPQLLRPHRQVFPTRLPGPSVVGPQACASCTYCRRTRMHGKAARPGKTIGFLSRENYYFPWPQSLSILPNSISPSHLELQPEVRTVERPFTQVFTHQGFFCR